MLGPLAMLTTVLAMASSEESHPLDRPASSFSEMIGEVLLAIEDRAPVATTRLIMPEFRQRFIRGRPGATVEFDSDIGDLVIGIQFFKRHLAEPHQDAAYTRFIRITTYMYATLEIRDLLRSLLEKGLGEDVEYDHSAEYIGVSSDGIITLPLHQSDPSYFKKEGEIPPDIDRAISEKLYELLTQTFDKHKALVDEITTLAREHDLTQEAP